MQTSTMENGLLKEISEKTGLILSENGQAVGGKYEDYNITINYFSEMFYIDIPIRATDECCVNEMNEILNYIGNKYKNITIAQYIDCSIKIQCLKEMEETKEELTIILILNEIIKFAKDKNLVTCCGNCGESRYVIPFIKDELLVPYCLECQFKEKEVSTVKKKNTTIKGINISAGILGAMIGSLIGLTVWILIARIGDVAYIGGFVIAVATIKGCEILGNGIDKKGLIISIGLIIFTVFLSQYTSYCIKYLSELMQRDGDISRIRFFKTINMNLFHSSESVTFYKDMFIGYLFTIVPIAYYITRKKK